MAHDGNAASDQMSNDVLMTGQALDLDGIRARLEQDAGGGGRDIPALAGGKKRQIGNDEKVRRPRRTAAT